MQRRTSHTGVEECIIVMSNSLAIIFKNTRKIIMTKTKNYDIKEISIIMKII